MLVGCLLLVGCGAPNGGATRDGESGRSESAEPSTGGDSPDPAGATPPTPAIVALPGSRVRLALAEGAVRARHGLHWRWPDTGAELRVSDATVQPGEERAVIEAGIAAFGDAAETRLLVVDGRDAVEVVVRTAAQVTRAVSVFDEGAVARVLVRHAPGEALFAERVFDSVRFDAASTLDPLRAMDADIAIAGLVLVPASTEQLFFREEPRATAFPSAGVSVDLLWVGFPEGPPDNDRARGQLLGSRFAGLTLSGTQWGPLEQGFELVSTLPPTNTEPEIALYGAYIEGPAGVWLLRASVDAARAPEWGPRFRTLAARLSEVP
ncbi:MAG: hypothetical protein AB8I08_00285 [Sandaracinaceae bacterium]